MNINIRLENEKDYFEVEKITRQAFWNLYIPGCNEHLIVHNIRKHNDFIKEVSFVIELNEQIVGSIFYTKSKVIDADGKENETITFGPVSIKPELHRRGLGAKLIKHSITKAKELGFGAIVIGGFPHHYKPYGFVGAKKYNIAMGDGNYYAGIMALPLIDGYLDNIKQGIIHFSEVMNVSDDEVELFDQKFEPMQKEIKECQNDFMIAVTEINTNVY